MYVSPPLVLRFPYTSRLNRVKLAGIPAVAETKPCPVAELLSAVVDGGIAWRQGKAQLPSMLSPFSLIDAVYIPDTVAKYLTI
jgi:hypothetical protein